MKTKILILAMAVFTMTACKNEKKEKTTETHSMEMKKGDMKNHNSMNKSDGHDHEHTTMNTHKDAKNMKQNATKNTATTPIINAYLQIKNGLVASDKNATAKGGTALLTAFSMFDMSSLSGKEHKEYMEIYENAKEQAEHIVKSPLDHQREHFEVLSTDINDMIALLGTEKTLYKDHCPMANGGKGANWLSEIKDIKNPYFGDKMMKCGKILNQIN